MKKIIITFILIIIAGILTGCKDKPVESISGTGFYFDTFCTFTVYGTEDERIIEDLKSECIRYVNIFSTTAESSELYRLNHGEINEVSKDLYECIERALFFSDYTDGHYDISIRPVSELWSFTQYVQTVPEKESIDEALAKVDHNDVKIEKTADGRYLVNMLSDMSLDLGSVAKGYIADRLAEYLKEKGIDSAVISLGGNIKCLGGKPSLEEESDTHFTIGIRSPFADNEESGESAESYADIVYIKDMSVVTSGIYERGFEKDGVFYHHLLDAKTGYPVENDLASVTIITGSSFNADLLSTVCFLLDYDKTVELKNSGIVDDFEAEFIYKDGSVKRTEGFMSFLDKNF